MFSIATFALILEYLSIKTYEAYQYSSSFLFQFSTSPDNVPIVIAIAWAIIISISMKFSDKTTLDERAKPFLDTLIALNIDLSMDAIAIRIEGGLWTWNKTLSNKITFDSFLGVRYGNFIGWYLIVFIFSSLLRIGRSKYQFPQKAYSLYLLSIPFLAFIPFYMMFEGIQQMKRIFNYDFYFVFVIVVLLIFSLYQISISQNVPRTIKSREIQSFEIWIFYSFHFFFFISMIYLRLYRAAPLLVVTSVIAITFHVIQSKNIYPFTRNRNKSFPKEMIGVKH